MCLGSRSYIGDVLLHTAGKLVLEDIGEPLEIFQNNLYQEVLNKYKDFKCEVRI